MNKVINELKKTLRNKTVLVACSTGVDSMVLLHLVESILPSTSIVVAHVNHQKRKQSVEEENYIIDYTNKRNIKCYTMKLDKIDNGNFQSIARTKRYEFFDDIAKLENIDYLLLAHHADDNLETIIMRFLKSSSIKGYAGIEKISNCGSYNIYRPLLSIPKKDIYDYAKKQNIKYYEDESNNELDYTRNRIRHLITPILLEENPKLYDAVNYYNDTLLNANLILEKEEFAFIENKILVNNNNDLLTYTIKQSDYNELTDFMKKQILFRLLKKYNLSHQCINEIIKKISSNKSNLVSVINPSINLIKEYGNIIFTEESLNPILYNQEITSEGIYMLPNNSKLEVGKNNCYFHTSNDKLWYNIENLPIIIRSRDDGDKINNKLVSDYLTNRKIPYLKKKDILLLCSKENNVLAVLGYKGGK